ncbi:MAG: hypothetical protein ACK56I_36360, partial [bacterium]
MARGQAGASAVSHCFEDGAGQLEVEDGAKAGEILFGFVADGPDFADEENIGVRCFHLGAEFFPESDGVVRTVIGEDMLGRV